MVITGTVGEGPGWVGYIIQPAAMPRGSVLYISRMFQPVMAIEGDGHGHIIAKWSGQAFLSRRCSGTPGYLQAASSATRSMRWTRPAWSGASGVTIRVVAPASRNAASRSAT